VQQVTAAAFTNDMRLLTSGVDKLLVMWEIRNNSDNSSIELNELGRMETRNYLDIVT
jgi:hypothetical protein